MKPSDLIGRAVSFDHRTHDGAIRRLTGVVTACRDGGFAEPGHIPDFRVTVQGASGALLEDLSMVNTHMLEKDTHG